MGMVVSVGVLNHKYAGEAAVRAAGVPYTVVRSVGLTSEDMDTSFLLETRQVRWHRYCYCLLVQGRLVTHPHRRCDGHMARRHHVVRGHVRDLSLPMSSTEELLCEQFAQVRFTYIMHTQLTSSLNFFSPVDIVSICILNRMGPHSCDGTMLFHGLFSAVPW